MMFFTADTHFGHANILELCNRPFETVEEMNETMIKNWNAKVKGSDNVFIVGDMFYRCDPAEAEVILQRLHGKKNLIIGNHDSSWMNKVELEKYFADVSDMKITSDGKHAITLCHYPLLNYKHQRKAYMIHGHLHAETSEDFFPLLCKRERVLNAGVDINGYAPVAFDELLANNNRFKDEYMKIQIKE